MAGIIITLAVLFLVVMPVLVVRLALSHRDLRRRTEGLEYRLRRLEQTGLAVPPLESEFMETVQPLEAASEPFVPPPITPAPALTTELLTRRHAPAAEPALVLKPFTSAVPPLISPAAGPVKTSELERPQPEVLRGTVPGAEPAPESSGPAINWERFLGVKLFAWLGGLALFIGMAFFVKYSFDHNLIPPWARIMLGYLVGLGLIAGGRALRREEYKTTAQTLMATGIVILYAASFTARAFYGLISTPALFGIMSLITVAALFLAVRKDAKVIAILGVLGGFLTPLLVGGKSEQAWPLFGYMLFLNVALLGMARLRGWRFLLSLGAVATALLECGWAATQLQAASAVSLVVMTSLLSAVFVAGALWLPDPSDENPHAQFGALLQGLAGLFIAWSLQPLAGVSGVLALAAAFLADAALLPLLWTSAAGVALPFATAGGAFLLASWIRHFSSPSNQFLTLAASVLFGALNSLLPLWSRAQQPKIRLWIRLAPVISLLLMFLLVQGAETPWSLWIGMLVTNFLLLALAFMTGSLLLAAAGVAITALLCGFWIAGLRQGYSAAGPVAVTAVFALLFSAGGLWMAERMPGAPDRNRAALFPIMPVIMPFLLMVQVMLRLRPESPTLIFSFALALDAMILFFSVRAGAPAMGATAFGATLFLEACWHLDHPASGAALAWYTAFALIFTAVPFLLRRRAENLTLWRMSALSTPLHFLLIMNTGRALLPDFAWPGLYPALLALPPLACLALTLREKDPTQRMQFTALYGASALFFLTLIFPIQFDREWITLGWAFEGMALIWLYRRAPAGWLAWTSAALLVISFARLALNPAVLEYHQRGSMRLLNWFLYAYGLAAAAQFVAARICPRDPLTLRLRLHPLFYTFGTVLVFCLLNIEIADLFATGPYLAFEFAGNFARDMTYSIAWSLFALALLLVGFLRNLKPARYSGIGLMLVTLVKLFLHDLSSLGSLYRIGAFMAVAVILIFASWIYQRYLTTASPQQAK